MKNINKIKVKFVCTNTKRQLKYSHKRMMKNMITEILSIIYFNT